MDKVFLHAGVFALVTLAIAAVCFWVAGREERANQRRR